MKTLTVAGCFAIAVAVWLGGAQNRYERIFEYDSLTPRFANFLLEERTGVVAWEPVKPPQPGL